MKMNLGVQRISNFFIPYSFSILTTVMTLGNCAQAPTPKDTFEEDSASVPPTSTPQRVQESSQDQAPIGFNDLGKSKNSDPTNGTKKDSTTPSPTASPSATKTPEPAYTPNPAHASDLGEYDYKIDDKNCTTGMHTGRKINLCVELLNEELNKNCAKTTRVDIHKKFCIQNLTWTEATSR